MIGRTNSSSGSGKISADRKPNITFDGKWSGWHIEFYDGAPYWEALFSSSGTLTNYGGAYTCDAWGIGGGGSGGNCSTIYQGGVGTGGGSGYTNMIEGITISASSSISVTIGAGGRNITSSGGNTVFLSLTCNGGSPGSSSSKTGGSGGSNGGGGHNPTNGGANGSPGAGKIMSKFWSAEHNNEYGAGGTANGDHDTNKCGGGGGYLDVGSNGCAGHGYGAGGGGYQYSYASTVTDSYGKSGCLIIRIAI